MLLEAKYIDPVSGEIKIAAFRSPVSAILPEGDSISMAVATFIIDIAAMPLYAFSKLCLIDGSINKPVEDALLAALR